MATLVLADFQGAELSPDTGRAVTAALALGAPVDVLVAGDSVGAVAGAAAKLDGVRKVLVAEDGSLAGSLSEPLAALVLSLADGYDALFAPATSTGKSVMPRVAARLDVMQVSEIIGVEGPRTFRRPIYAGNAIETVESGDPKLVVTVRGSAFEAPAEGGAAAIESVSAPAPSDRSRFVSAEVSAGDRPDLSSARVVVSGGRALGSKEKFDALILPLADRLGAAVGASRAAVDAGFAPNDLQVGQTGKIVAPDLYIACGISGAIQHLAGMKDSGVIVAINTDADAPIFEIADYGLVADLFEALPELEKALAGP